MTLRPPEPNGGELPPDLADALATILADALVADIVQYPTLGGQPTAPPDNGGAPGRPVESTGGDGRAT